MEPIRCAVKKRGGSLSLAKDVLTWKAEDGGASEVMPLLNVQGMQATPPTAAKMRIKLSPKSGTALVLEFPDAEALEHARMELQVAIKQFRERVESGGAAASAVKPSGPAGSSTASASTGSATSDGPPAAKKKKVSLEPAKLLTNIELQRLVLRQDPELMRTFEQVVVASGALTNAQFWTPRLHLLVTAAQQQIQLRGTYNVLSTIKPSTGSDNRVNINLTREKIGDLFDQYPLVRRAYNENVPRLSEGEFWQRFFMSRLFLVLRGEKIAPTHATDVILDPYIELLHELQEKQRQRRREDDSLHPAPLFVNVEANAENNPETYGNNIVTTAGGGTRRLIRSMNGLSQRLLRGKRKIREAEEDTLHGVGTMAADLRLGDLAAPENTDQDVALNLDMLVEQEQELAEQELSRDGSRRQLRPPLSDEEARQLNAALPAMMPSRLSLDELLDRPELCTEAQNTVDTLTPKETAAVEGVVSGDVQLVYATTAEFLKQFWYAYHRKPRAEVRPLRDFLSKSLDRIAAVQGLPALQSLVDCVETALKVPL